MERVKFRDSKRSKAIADLAKQTDHRLLARWATDCAEHVLSLFEAHCPGDNRPREAIEAGRAWVRGEIPMVEARAAAFASHTAARDIEHPAACAAARAAGHASATAHVAGHAVHAATYAAKAAAYAADDPSETSSSIAKERDWQYQRLLDLQQ
ncbi:putative immunity protein [Paenibacillus guangzhouensis]|uniref:putative immunity protein n=1 Tax=Paenibacillus guangzhouensis TaxID=1473112 RepID=UPI001266CF7C|nr:hypothetical protein [Paenibacillus guangzhouensis]